MTRDGLTFFPAYFECTKGMDDKQARRFLYAIADYAFRDVDPSFVDGSMEQAIWVVVQPSLDKSKLYKERSEKASIASSQKRAVSNSSSNSTSLSLSLNANKLEHKHEPTKTIDIDNDTDIDTDTDVDSDVDKGIDKDIDVPNGTYKKKSGKEKFVPPTVEQVAAYCMERNNGIDPEAFIAYYESQGWKKANGTKVVDWKGCVRTWESRNKDSQAEQRKDEPWHWSPITAEAYDA